MIVFLLSHVWVKNGQEYKHDLMYRVLSHYRHNFPNEPIILSGHGIRPPDKVTEKANYFVWHDEIINTEVGRGHPQCVSEGIKIAKEIGATHIFKNRADMVVCCKDIFKRCFKKMNMENKKGIGFFEGDMLHDITIFSETETMEQAWDTSKWNPSSRINGVINSNNALIEHGHKIKSLFYQAHSDDLPVAFLDPWWENKFKTMPDEQFFNNNFDWVKHTFFSGYSRRAQAL